MQGVGDTDFVTRYLRVSWDPLPIPRMRRLQGTPHPRALHPLTMEID